MLNEHTLADTDLLEESKNLQAICHTLPAHHKFLPFSSTQHSFIIRELSKSRRICEAGRTYLCLNLLVDA
jgi:hypothetical protein